MAKPTNLDITPPSGYHLHQSLSVRTGTCPGGPRGCARSVRHRQAVHRGPAGARSGHDRHRQSHRHRVQALPGRHLGSGSDRLGYREPDSACPRLARWPGHQDREPARELGRQPVSARGGHGARRPGRDSPEPRTAGSGQRQPVRESSLPAAARQPGRGPGRLLVADEALVQALGPVFTSTFTDVLPFDWLRYLSHVSDWEISEYREMCKGRPCQPNRPSQRAPPQAISRGPATSPARSGLPGRRPGSVTADGDRVQVRLRPLSRPQAADNRPASGRRRCRRMGRGTHRRAPGVLPGHRREHLVSDR